MIKQYLKCTLLSDIVINASLATEGNMKTLDYIPGSNFLGIVAGQLYKKKKEEGKQEELMTIFHSGKVSFGDANIACQEVDKTESYTRTYAIPLALFRDKLEKEVTGNKANLWVHGFINNKQPPTSIDGRRRQLKQLRGGYFDYTGNYIASINKRFALKSAQDRSARRSKDGAMFGFESMLKGQVFIFCITFDDSVGEETRKEVITALEGKKRVGKSKSAQYGQVEIESLTSVPKGFDNGEKNTEEVIVYAESNLCFFNEYGQSTFQPKGSDFNIDGEINWSKSQVRTYSYSPWNFHRNTTDPQRDCILKGSVLVIDVKDAVIDNLPTSIGAYQSEGLGRVIYNPSFLKKKDAEGKWDFILKAYPSKEVLANASKASPVITTPPTTAIGSFLAMRKARTDKELKIGIAIHEFMQGKHEKSRRSHESIFKHVPSSQWGGIRNKAIRAENIDELIQQLFDEEQGILENGVAAERYWDKEKGLSRTVLKQIIEEHKTMNTLFTAKLATEMAKWKQQIDSSTIETPNS